MKSTETLPDSRMKTIHTPRGMIQGPGGTWVPIFCANCGTEGGACPAENMNFLFYLCNKCAETYGQIAGVMLMPDEVFFEKLKEEMQASYGRALTDTELAAALEADPASPLAKLIKSRRQS